MAFKRSKRSRGPKKYLEQVGETLLVQFLMESGILVGPFPVVFRSVVGGFSMPMFNAIYWKGVERSTFLMVKSMAFWALIHWQPYCFKGLYPAFFNSHRSRGGYMLWNEQLKAIEGKLLRRAWSYFSSFLCMVMITGTMVVSATSIIFRIRNLGPLDKENIVISDDHERIWNQRPFKPSLANFFRIKELSFLLAVFNRFLGTTFRSRLGRTEPWWWGTMFYHTTPTLDFMECWTFPIKEGSKFFSWIALANTLKLFVNEEAVRPWGMKRC